MTLSKCMLIQRMLPIEGMLYSQQINKLSEFAQFGVRPQLINQLDSFISYLNSISIAKSELQVYQYT